MIFNRVNRGSIRSLFQSRPTCLARQWRIFLQASQIFRKTFELSGTSYSLKPGSEICNTLCLGLGPIVIIVIAAGVIVVVVGIEGAADVVDLTLGARDLHFITRCTVFAGLHREHLHLLLETELLRHRADLRILLLLLLLRQSLLPRIPWGSKCCFSALVQKVTLI